MLVPMVIESSSRGERAYDIYSRLLKERIIFLGDAIEDHVANLVIDKVNKLREMSPLWEMHKDGIDLTQVQWAAH